MNDFKKSIRPYVIVVTILFILALFQGYFFAAKNQGEALIRVEQLFSEFGFISDLSSFEIFLFIFVNNAVKSFISIFLGFVFGIVPIMYALINGYFLGVVVYVASLEIGLKNVFLSLFPHGIIEVPTFLVASGIGLWLGIKFYNKLTKGETFKDSFLIAMKVYFKFILPLLLLAAFIETYITPAVVEWLVN